MDIHNYGYTILNLNVKNKLIIWFAKKYERIFGRKAVRAWCVSNRMKEDLATNWGVYAVTLYDRPVRKAKTGIDKQKFLSKYGQRPIREGELLLVSSTSWTKDEDFSILLDALELY